MTHAQAHAHANPAPAMFPTIGSHALARVDEPAPVILQGDNVPDGAPADSVWVRSGPAIGASIEGVVIALYVRTR